MEDEIFYGQKSITFRDKATFSRVTQNSTFDRTGPLIGSLEYLIVHT